MFHSQIDSAPIRALAKSDPAAAARCWHAELRICGDESSSSTWKCTPPRKVIHFSGWIRAQDRLTGWLDGCSPQARSSEGLRVMGWEEEEEGKVIHLQPCGSVKDIMK